MPRHLGRLLGSIWSLLATTLQAVEDGKLSRSELAELLEELRTAIQHGVRDESTLPAWLAELDPRELAGELLELWSTVGPLLEHVNLADFMEELDGQAAQVAHELLVRHAPELMPDVEEVEPASFPWYSPGLHALPEREWARTIARYYIALQEVTGHPQHEQHEQDCGAMLLPEELSQEVWDLELTARAHEVAAQSGRRRH